MNQQLSSFIKKNLPVIVATLVFLLLTFLLRQIHFRQLRRTFTQNYKEIYKDSPTVEIAGFNEAEQWQGNVTFDSMRSFDGPTGMNLTSNQGMQNTITLSKSVDLSSYEHVYLYVFVDKASTLPNIDSLTLQFASKDQASTSSDITGLHEGWNFVALAKNKFDNGSFNWKSITATSLSLTAQKNATAQVAFDRLWAQKNLKNTNTLSVYQPEFLNTQTIGKNTYLHLGAPVQSNVVLNKTVKNDFEFTVGLAPFKFGVFGLTFQTDKNNRYGYYLEITGQKMDHWKLYKKESGNITQLQNGVFTDNLFEQEAYTWLRVGKKGDTIDLSLSLNHQLFVPVAQVKDSSFSSGYIGVFAQGSYLLDSIEVKE